jgi:hypothetical protein
LVTGVQAADHGDTPLLTTLNRHDGKMTDWHAFHTPGGKFVMSACTNPNIPVGQATYIFPADLSVRFHIDNKADVSFSDPVLNAKYGGKLTKPSKIKSRITLEFSFDENNQPVLHADGIRDRDLDQIQVFAGLRDDPFINGLRFGRNSACIVAEMPLDLVQHGHHDEMVTWTTTKIADVAGPISEHSGRALRSQQPVNDPMNTLSPAAHWTELGLVPDVAIHRLDQTAGFPNGRIFTDDVIDQTMDPPFANPAAQAPTENDKPFLAVFPYLPEPW